MSSSRQRRSGGASRRSELQVALEPRALAVTVEAAHEENEAGTNVYGLQTRGSELVLDAPARRRNRLRLLLLDKALSLLLLLHRLLKLVRPGPERCSR